MRKKLNKLKSNASKALKATKDFFVKLVYLFINDFPSTLVKSRVDHSPSAPDARHMTNITRHFWNTDKLCLIGPWGSGKSTLALTYAQLSQKKHSVRFATFAVISKLSHGYYQLIYRRIWLLLFSILTSLTIYFLINDLPEAVTNTPAWFFFILSLFLIFSDKSRVAYLTLSISQLFLLPSKKLVIIDDLDRSSLPISDQFAILSNLFPWGHKYLITYGYHSETEYFEIVEMLKKLKIPFYKINSAPINLIAHAKELDGRFPFEKEEWMDILSFRDIEALVYEVKLQTTEPEGPLNDEIVRLTYVRAMFKLWCRKHKIDYEENKISNTINFGLPKKPIDSVYKRDDLNKKHLSFGTSISELLLNTINSDHENVGRSSNWAEISISKLLLKGTEPYDDIPDIDG